MGNYVLDSFALLAYYQNEAGAKKVADLLRRSKAKEIEIYCSEINLGEVFYILGRKRSLEAAKKMVANFGSLPILPVLPRHEDILKAAEYKIFGGISYADSFSLQLAVEKRATLITGDREFKKWEKEIKKEWI